MSEDVTTVVRHRVKTGHEAEYEAALKALVPVAHAFPGHRSANIIRPADGSGVYTTVVHFDGLANLRAFLESDVRRAFLDQVTPILAAPDQVEIKTGLEFWFTPPAAGAAPRRAKPWKQYLVTLSAIFPLTLGAAYAFAAAADGLPGWLLSIPVRTFVTAAIVVALLIWIIMPRYTRLVARWLFR